MIIPTSTYRIQFNSEFKFTDAEKIIPYLSELGISTIYASPIFKARKGSSHGYDVVEHNSLNPEIGSEDDFDSLIETVHKFKMNWLQDIVPNHMAYSFENKMLVDLLENGIKSNFYDYFDIEWSSTFLGPSPRILAPFLGEFYKDALESGKLKLKYEKSGFSVNYYDNKLPLKIESYADILSYRIEELKHRHGKNHPDVIKYMGILYVVRSLPEVEDADERYDQIKFIKRLIWEIYNENKNVKVFIDENIKIFNGESQEPHSFRLLDNLLNVQNFRLCFWKVATEEINYRRFFNVNELISLKMENENAFNRIHSLIFKFVKEEKFNGLRIDHVDGLYDPTNYLERLKSNTKDIFLVVEKILDPEEEIPDFWNIEGTSGYDFLGLVNSLFCKKENEEKFTKIYKDFTGENFVLDEIIRDKKRLIIETRMAGDVERLAALVKEVTLHDRYGVDITMHSVKKVIEEILTYFPVYRTYINPEHFSEKDKEYWQKTLVKVKSKNKLLIKEIEYIENILLQNFPDYYTQEQKIQSLNLIQKFQQLTGPLMAKGFEDTTFYIYNRLISLNEVGGDPGKFGLSKNDFYNFLDRRNRKLPDTLNTISTHDTKRGEDTRARINVLSEIPDAWQERISLWQALNRQYKYENTPDNNDEYFLYQTLIGSFPFNGKINEKYLSRIKEYIIKAVREAKVHTAWLKPDETYENTFLHFIDKILDQTDENQFLEDFSSFHKKIAFYGMLNSLSQSLLNLTVPGVPDIYRGSELWNLSLVDPDNRAPVDYEIRQKYLDEIIETDKNLNTDFLEKLKKEFPSGQIKQFVIHKVLNERKIEKELFSEGDFLEIEVEGKHSQNVTAFCRKIKDKTAIIIAPRFYTEIYKSPNFDKSEWEDTFLFLPKSEKNFKDLFSNSSFMENKVFMKNVLEKFPVAFLKNY